jgi:hypothetical protein
MPRRNSSTLDSEPIGPPGLPHKTAILRTIIWLLLILVAFDAGVNLAFPFPSNPLDIDVSAVKRYFDYGRSIEGKFLRQIGPTDETSAPIARAGWLADIPSKGNPAKPKPGHILVSFYGMSFAGNIAGEVQRLDPTIDIRLVLGPAAPPNYSFEAYLRDRGSHESDIVVFGILASSVAGMDSMSGAGLGTDSPAPFTFPLFTLENGRLAKIEPLVQSLSDLRATMGDAARRLAYRNQLYRYDKFISPIMFEANVLDKSALYRLGRRAYDNAYQDRAKSKIHDQEGFLPGWGKVPVLKAMLSEFADTARADGRKPLVLLIQDRGYNDHLYRLLGETLDSKGIPFVSTHTSAPASDITNFISDGHFTQEANHRVSVEVLATIMRLAIR